VHSESIGYLSSDPTGGRTSRQAIRPLKLDYGASLGLFSPAEPLIPERLRTLEASVALLEQHGYRITYAPNARVQGTYAAGTPDERASDIHGLASDPGIDGLFATWGGKSCNQLLALLDYDLLLKARKPILGFSDVAVLLNAITARTGLLTYHFLVAGRMPETHHSDLALARGDTSNFGDVFDFSATDLPRSVFREGRAQGVLFGGNLSTFVVGLLGTDFLEEMHDIVFFWESASERPMVVDQHLTALRNAGFFERVRAMVIGSVFAGGELTGAEIGEAIKNATADYDFPIIYSPTFGHLPTRNPLVPLGANCAVDSETFSVVLTEESVVAEHTHMLRERP
jgi:muramoyltetrapeptide carboxypeptidase